MYKGQLISKCLFGLIEWKKKKSTWGTMIEDRRGTTGGRTGRGIATGGTETREGHVQLVTKCKLNLNEQSFLCNFFLVPLPRTNKNNFLYLRDIWTSKGQESGPRSRWSGQGPRQRPGEGRRGSRQGPRPRRWPRSWWPWSEPQVIRICMDGSVDVNSRVVWSRNGVKSPARLPSIGKRIYPLLRHFVNMYGRVNWQ